MLNSIDKKELIMGIFEFLFRIADNIAWIARTDDPMEVARAINNIIILLTGNLYNLIILPIINFFSC